MRSLIYLDPDKLGDLLQMYVKESTALREQIAEICMHMAGGLEYNTAWGISFEDREIIIKVINKSIKAKNPSGPEYM